MRSTSKTLNSIGFVAATLSTPPAKILRIAGELRIEPVLTLNAISHFSDSQVELIAERLRQNRSKK
jgi:hypothetical protein